ncbi:MAG: redoxin domain-containing protein [Thiovulaceae bacterium]|nr:redoxin domain-containing protein [Sulfurimonadaceae bacterium]
MKNWNFKKLLREAAIFAVLLFIFSNALSYLKSPDLGNKKLPEFQATMLNEKTFDSLQVKHDKPLLIHFWATWCPTCKMENSTIDALSKKFDVITIAVNSKSDADIKAFLKEKNLSFQVINDTNSSLAEHFHVSGFPTTFIYNKDGNLEFSEVGYSSYITLYLKLLYASR